MRSSFPQDSRSRIGEDGKVYSDEELALILHKAAELAKPSNAAGDSSSGLSLEEIKAVAAEVGLDPALIERAARLIPQGPRESRFVRLIGGPLQHRPDVHFPTKLTDERAAHLLSAVRATVEREGEGQANSSGMSWHSKTGGEPDLCERQRRNGRDTRPRSPRYTR